MFETSVGYDAGGRFLEFYRETDSGPEIQRWYGPERVGTVLPKDGAWRSIQPDNGPDRTDPGYRLDNH